MEEKRLIWCRVEKRTSFVTVWVMNKKLKQILTYAGCIIGIPIVMLSLGSIIHESYLYFGGVIFCLGYIATQMESE